MRNSPGLDIHRTGEGARFVVVDRLEDRLALAAEQAEVLLHDVDVIGRRIQSRKAVGSTLSTVEGVVVVHTDDRYPLGTEDLDDAIGQRRPAGGRVTDDTEYHGMLDRTGLRFRVDRWRQRFFNHRRI